MKSDDLKDFFKYKISNGNLKYGDVSNFLYFNYYHFLIKLFMEYPNLKFNVFYSLICSDDNLIKEKINKVSLRTWFYKIKKNKEKFIQDELKNYDNIRSLKMNESNILQYDCILNSGGVSQINTATKIPRTQENFGAAAGRSIGSRQEMANAKIKPAPSLSGAGSVAPQKQTATSPKSVAPAIISDQKILEERDKKFLEELMGNQKKIEIDEEANFLSYLPKVEGVLKPLLNLEKYVKSILFGDNIYAVRAFEKSGYTLYYDELGTIFDPFTKNAKRYSSVKNVNGNKEIILNLEDPLPVPVHFRGHTYIEGNFIYIYEKKNLGLTETVNPLSSTLEQELFKTFRQKWGNKRDYRQFFHNINNLS